MSFEDQSLASLLPDLFPDDLFLSPVALGIQNVIDMGSRNPQSKGLSLEKIPELNIVKKSSKGIIEGYLGGNLQTHFLNHSTEYSELSLPNIKGFGESRERTDDLDLTGSSGVNLAVAQDFVDKHDHLTKPSDTKQRDLQLPFVQSPASTLGQGANNNFSNCLHLGVGSQSHAASGNHGKPDSTSPSPATLPTPFKIGFGDGLKAEYFNGKDLTDSVLVRTDATVDFDWDVGSPDPAIDPNKFSAVWTGFVQPLYDEKYTFSTQSDDGVRLWVNDQLLVDHWKNGNAKERSGFINLEAGEFYSIRLEYFEQGGQARSKLLWSSESQVKQIIPTSQLYTDLDQPLIGVIDTGFASNNSDFNYNRITLGQDRVGNDANPLLAEGEGNEHGTHILGLIAATQNNGLGIDGINNNAPLWVGRAIGDGEWAQSLREYVDAFLVSDWKNGVINLSFDLIQRNTDGTLSTRYELTPEERDALEYARQNGVLIVAAAGNNGGVMSVLGQASQEFDNILTVGAADGENRAAYSSYGYGLDILAAGGTVENPVLSTVADSVGTMAGTSVATAIVTGVVSQVWHENPELSYRQVIEILKATATDLNTTGWDLETGAGLVDMEKALQKAKDTTPEVYDPVDFSTPTTWGGAGLVTPLEHEVNFYGEIKSLGDTAITQFLKIRSGPGTNYTEVDRIFIGTRTLVFEDNVVQGDPNGAYTDQSGLGTHNEWLKLADGRGYMLAFYIANVGQVDSPDDTTNSSPDNTNSSTDTTTTPDTTTPPDSGSGADSITDPDPTPPPAPTSTTINGYTIDGSFYSVYLNYQGILGNPIEAIQNYSNGISYQRFENGSIVSSSSGTYPLYGAIRNSYLNTGGLNGWLGAPKSAEIGRGNGTIIQYFEGGYVYFNGQKAVAYKTSTQSTSKINLNNKVGSLLSFSDIPLSTGTTFDENNQYMASNSSMNHPKWSSDVYHLINSTDPIFSKAANQLQDRGAGKYGGTKIDFFEWLSAMQKINMWRDVARVALGIGYTDAARNLYHYLDNSGEDSSVDVDRMLNDMNDFQAIFDDRIQQIHDAVNSYISSGTISKKTSINIGTDWNLNTKFYAGESKYPKWFYAMGGFYYRVVAQVEITPSSNSVNVNMVSQIQVYDRYNWDEGKQTKLLGVFTVSDSDLAYFNRIGIAQEYNIFGESSVSKQSWTLIIQDEKPNSGWA